MLYDVSDMELLQRNTKQMAIRSVRAKNSINSISSSSKMLLLYYFLHSFLISRPKSCGDPLFLIYPK